MFEYIAYLNRHYYWWVLGSLFAWSAPGWYYLYISMSELDNGKAWAISMLAACVVGVVGSAR